MQENDRHTWQAAQRRPRVVAAVVLASSCMIIGFVGGRLSTRILTPTPATAATEDAQTTTPTAPKVASSQESTALAPSKPERTPLDEPQKVARTPPSSAGPPVVLLNPGSVAQDAPKSPKTDPRVQEGARSNTFDEDGERDRVRRIRRERGETEERARDAARTPPKRSDYRALREYMLGR